jgi:LPXTG-motif cell wall-anchored protein
VDNDLDRTFVVNGDLDGDGTLTTPEEAAVREAARTLTHGATPAEAAQVAGSQGVSPTLANRAVERVSTPLGASPTAARAKGTLPSTGGINVAWLGLAAGAMMVTAGLVIRRVTR